MPIACEQELTDAPPKYDARTISTALMSLNNSSLFSCFMMWGFLSFGAKVVHLFRRVATEPKRSYDGRFCQVPFLRYGIVLIVRFYIQVLKYVLQHKNIGIVKQTLQM